MVDENLHVSRPVEEPAAVLTPEELVPIVPLEEVSSLPSEGRLRRALHATKYALQSAVITAEILPITNEGSRYGALAATEVITRNPLIGAAVLGGSTLLVEGAGALAASEVLTSNTSNKLFSWLNRKMEKIVPTGAKVSRPVEAGVAMVAGTPTLMAVKQRQNPERTAKEARRYGLVTSAWMAGVFAVEGAMISEGAGNYTDPKTIGAVLLAVGALAALPKWVQRALKRDSQETFIHEAGEVSRIMNGGALSEEALQKSATFYESFRDQEDEAVKIGLYGEDLSAALNNSDSVLAEYTSDAGEKVAAPLLVPAEQLKWYNMDLLKKTYGYGKDFYYYTHPPVPASKHSQAQLANVLREKLDKGAIIFTDQYASQLDVAVLDLVTQGQQSSYSIDNLGGGDKQRTGEVFVGPVTFEGVKEIKPAPPISEIYRQCIESGELSENSSEGVSLVDVIDGEDAERIWQIYQDPFDELSKDHPMYAGFDKEELMAILRDPDVAKMVNRVDGTITTLCFFVQNFDHCPWFNKEYYQEQYPEYYDTDNILIFPGIVTDQNMRGNDYALHVIDLATKLYAKRDSNVLVTFECTETSAAYIPTIVEMAIGHSGVGTVEGVKEPISVTEYKALSKRS